MNPLSQPFAVTFQLSAPIAAGQGPAKPPMIMLDGLVAYAVAQERFGPRGFVRRPHRHAFVELALPLEEVLPGIYSASQGFVAESRRQVMVLVQQGWPKSRSRLIPRIIPLATTATPTITFFGRGDLDQVLALLRQHIQFLGGKRGAGYGHVLNITGTVVDRDLSWGRFDETGVHLHRPMPVGSDAQLQQVIQKTWGDSAKAWWIDHVARWPRERMAVSPPYYDPNRHQWCYSPDVWGLIESVPFVSLPTADLSEEYSEDDYDLEPEWDTENR